MRSCACATDALPTAIAAAAKRIRDVLAVSVFITTSLFSELTFVPSPHAYAWSALLGRSCPFRWERGEHLVDRLLGDRGVRFRVIRQRVGRRPVPDRLLAAGVEDVNDHRANREVIDIGRRVAEATSEAAPTPTAPP